MKSAGDPDIHELLVQRIGQRLRRMGLQEEDLTSDLDLLRSGILDSLSFVDLIADLMDATGQDVDLETALESPGATTVGGVIRLFR